MVNITAEVTNEEVKAWKGVHLLYFWFSSCSQKVRILLEEKGVAYTPHHIDLVTCENATAWFLNINKRGFVPILVHDGQIIIESNDLMEYIDETFPSPGGSEGRSFFPKSEEDVAFTKDSLSIEDALHEDMRSLTFGFILPRALAAKPAQKLKDYETLGAEDAKRAEEVAWWSKYALDGVPEADVVSSVKNYTQAFEMLESRLADGRRFLCGDYMTIVDVAWAINMNRVELCGFPLQTKFPKLYAMFTNLRQRPSFQKAFAMEMPVPVFRAVYQTYQWFTGRTLSKLGNLEPSGLATSAILARAAMVGVLAVVVCGIFKK